MGEHRKRSRPVGLEAYKAPEFVRLPAELLVPLRAGEDRHAALVAEANDITQRSSSVATAFLLGLGIDTNKHVYTIDLPNGALVLQKPATDQAAGKTAEPAVAATQ
jgi:hypothetical protein